VVVNASENLACGIMVGRCGKIGPRALPVLKQYCLLVVEVFLFLGW